MSYTEIQERGKSKYYYRSLSKREGNKISKIRRYLGKNLTNEELKRLEEEMDIGLGKPLQKVLSKKEIDSLETIKKNHKQSCKSNFDIKQSTLSFEVTGGEEKEATTTPVTGLTTAVSGFKGSSLFWIIGDVVLVIIALFFIKAIFFGKKD